MKHALLALLAAALLLTACGGDRNGEAPPSPAGTAAWDTAPAFHANGNPAQLEDWGQFRIEDGRLVLAEGIMPYGLNTALFSDYAVKLRTVWIPEGAGPAGWQESESFDFPVGTVITKTFYYPRAGTGGFDEVALDPDPHAHFDGQALDLSAVRVIETRILVRREEGWAALPYAWNDDQRSTRLARTGAFVDLTLIDAGGRTSALAYQVPDVNQCAQCHVTNASDGQLRPIGPRARHLNGTYPYADGPANQLARWHEAGLLTGGPDAQDLPASASWHGETTLTGMALENAARAYIDINCAHCHSRTGHARTSGLYLEPSEPVGAAFGVCKPPIAAGRGTGNRLYSIVPGDSHASIFTFRMETLRADAMMPELGRSLPHAEGVALVSRWIDAMAGGC
jgi:uncharacterized repeat protein (TIGR03806 family)